MCPNDNDLLATISEGIVDIWHLQRLWSRNEFSPKTAHMPNRNPTCFAWGKLHDGWQALYVGCASGELVCIEAASAEAFIVHGKDGVPYPNVALTNEEGVAVTSVCVNQSYVMAGLANGAVQLYQHGFTDNPVLLLHESSMPENDGHVVWSRFSAYSHREGSKCSVLAGTSAAAILFLDFDGVTSVIPEAAAAAEASGSGDAAEAEEEEERGSRHGSEAHSGSQSPSHAPGLQPSHNGVMDCHALLSYHQGSVTGVGAHVNGTHVITSGVDGSVRLWDCAVSYYPHVEFEFEYLHPGAVQ